MSTVKRILPQSNELPWENIVACCRVSTKAKDQLDSLATREYYYEDNIRAHPNWRFVGIYSDVGSGTTLKGRKWFNALIPACKRGKVDIYFEMVDIHLHS